MKDMLDTKHEGCGGTFKEINIWEDIACNKCGQGTDRYIYTPEEELSYQRAEEQRAREKAEQERQKRYELFLKLKAEFEPGSS